MNMNTQKRKPSAKSTTKPSLLLGAKLGSKTTKSKNVSGISHTSKKRKVSPQIEKMGYWWGLGGAGGSFILATIAKHFFGV